MLFKGEIRQLKDALQFQTLLTELYKKDWYVYCKRFFGSTVQGPLAILEVYIKISVIPSKSDTQVYLISLHESTSPIKYPFKKVGAMTISNYV